MDHQRPLGELGGAAGPAGESRAKDPDPPKPPPAPRGLKTQPQAAQPSRGFRGLGWDGRMDHQRPSGELRPTGPARSDVDGWVEG